MLRNKTKKESDKGNGGDPWRLMEKGSGRTILNIFLLLVAAFLCSNFLEFSISKATLRVFLKSKPWNQWNPSSDQSKKLGGIQWKCTPTVNQTYSCPIPLISPAVTYESRKDDDDDHEKAGGSCPDYFKWIHEDLRPWKVTGITREMVERGAKSSADFRLVIVNGRAYIERYKTSFQTRDLFTWWGIVQLLRKYPGKLPDLDLIFNCADQPQIRSSDYQQPNASAPPPLFQYSGNASSLPIVFPDWSFWGWPELNIKPWEVLLKELKESNERTKWIDRQPYAFWKGNPFTSQSRKDLMKCNSTYTDKQDWKLRAYAQDWKSEILHGFKQSDLTKQCTHRYKIYVEGRSWSVSQKHALACDSVPLFVEPKFYDFVTRSLIPMYHYWPIKRNDDMCKSIKFAVDWGNIYKQEAQAIGRAASNFIQEELKMDYVYDYMLNLLKEYAKLLKYKPTIPERAFEHCSETMACPADGLVKKYMTDSMVKAPADTSPCTMPPPFDRPAMQAFLNQKDVTKMQVEAMGRTL
ncbi:protein O-glucosyltransferase 1-like [Macadamia integrifolia]|uniref:protein O-glucosyltransferase 1-like n=1 Tax=Macadamia integrifolia TaxID=60698 RepID=UPI001C4F5836|nr:protein O-glucosyltransferase 1-like [Macadamia integrifolia]